MKFIHVIFIIVLSICPLKSIECNTSFVQQDDSVIALTDATIINSNEPRFQKHQTIIIRKGIISEIGSNSSLNIPLNARIIDLSGKYVIPGLIDGHIHLRVFPDAQLEYALRWGITSIRSMGDDASYLELLKSDIKNGSILSPDIYYSSMIFGVEFYNLNRSRVLQLHSDQYKLGGEPWMSIVDSTTCFKTVIQRAKEYGVSGIKVYSHISKDQLVEITELAHLMGIKVWSHPHLVYTDTRAIVNCRVDLITHASYLLMPSSWDVRINGYLMDTASITTGNIDDLLSSIKRNHILLEPTLVIGLQEFNKRKINPEIINMNILILRKAIAKGIPIVAGTDLPLPQMVTDTPLLYKELEYFVEMLWMSPADAIKCATLNNAYSLGIEKTHGSIDVGKVSDMVVLNRNPLDSIKNLAEIYCVIKHGKIINH